MTLATATKRGVPSARIVLLKGYDEAGFVFYTNMESRKGRELAANAHAALLFHWKTMARQVRIEGTTARVSDEEADAYYASRARISRLGAWASDQSRPLESREVLEARVAQADARYPDRDIPRPPHWTGTRLRPERFEFWRDMPFRLHERVVFTRAAEGWKTEMLYP